MTVKGWWRIQVCLVGLGLPVGAMQNNGRLGMARLKHEDLPYFPYLRCKVPCFRTMTRWLSGPEHAKNAPRKIEGGTSDKIASCNRPSHGSRSRRHDHEPAGLKYQNPHKPRHTFGLFSNRPLLPIPTSITERFRLFSLLKSSLVSSFPKHSFFCFCLSTSSRLIHVERGIREVGEEKVRSDAFCREALNSSSSTRFSQGSRPFLLQHSLTLTTPTCHDHCLIRGVAC